MLQKHLLLLTADTLLTATILFALGGLPLQTDEYIFCAIIIATAFFPAAVLMHLKSTKTAYIAMTILSSAYAAMYVLWYWQHVPV